ncbi:hypothetical protein H632_c2859p0 [Helicosporidium sp. ATCC 50920]|nr:hypothetical protein H632_c2859p0 [Helicosporidium sp. ATCC 50920]|eukprot:KDD72818.1 hypothetical protein H632_c2859p0 [Helicosporidium sp. ATCC 50920]
MRCLALAARDASWPVRDAAAVGAGRVAGTGLREAWAWVGRFQELWEAHLGDGVPSVREGAAQALADALRGGRALREELEKAEEGEKEASEVLSDRGEKKGIFGISDAAAANSTARGSMLGKGRRQKRSGARSAALEGFPAPPAPDPPQAALLASIDAFAEKVVSILDAALDSAEAQPAEPGWTLAHGGDRPVPVAAVAPGKGERPFSWGALTPAVARGADCCVDHGYSKPPEAWERAEGGVHLARELAGLQPETVVKRLPRIAELASLNQFAGSLALKRAVWRSLPVVAQEAGLRRFKTHLELFLPELFRGLQCGHPLTEAAAASCAGGLRDLLGPGVWDGRLSPEQRELMRRSALVPEPRGRYALVPKSGGVSKHAGLMAPLPPEAQLRAPRMSAGHITAPLALH